MTGWAVPLMHEDVMRRKKQGRLVDQPTLMRVLVFQQGPGGATEGAGHQSQRLNGKPRVTTVPQSYLKPYLDRT